MEHSHTAIRTGLTRRSLLKLCLAVASLLVMPASLGPVMASVLATRKRRPVIWLSFQECTGCTESLTRADAPTLEQLMFEFLSLDYHHTLQAAAGDRAEIARLQTMSRYPREYLLIVDGSVPTGAGGAYSTIGGVSNLALLRECTAQHSSAPLRLHRRPARGARGLSQDPGGHTMNYALRTSTSPQVHRRILLACLVLLGLPAFGQSGAQPRPFTIHDTDGDGYLNREEYRLLLELRRLRKQQRGRMVPQPAPAFDEIDRDRDGRIGEQELTDMLHHKMYRYRRGGPPWR